MIDSRSGLAPRRVTAWPYALLSAAILFHPSVAETEEAVDEKARASTFRAFAFQEADRYTFRRAGATGKAFTRSPESLLHWSNPVSGSICGETFVWTENGRPEVLGSFYRWFSPFRHRANEFTSLAATPVETDRLGQRVWTTRGPGVSFQPIPGAPAPASTSPQRLRQMRELAKDFTARHVDEDKTERDMRLLNQPLYRYETTGDHPIDGGLFVFVLGTDPDGVLLIESRLSDREPRWEYALARMTHLEIRISHRGQLVWTAPRLVYATAVRGHTETYTEFAFKPGQDPNPPPDSEAKP